jgi:hypothetical protein
MKALIQFTILLSGIVAMPSLCLAQLENIIVEKYYISDANDATDTLGGGIEPGTTTYRVYADLAQGTKLRRIYGDASHPIIFSSTEPFFNNKADGRSFGYQFARNRYRENTVALDTWITISSTTTSSARQGGILKANDLNGSFIGGVNNDGGSAEIADGLLVNAVSELGIPLTTADGMDSLDILPTGFNHYGFEDIISGDDSTILGSIVPQNYFESRNAGLLCEGAMGVDTIVNHVLLAQLTTKGELEFEINIELEVPAAVGTNIVKYVARDSGIIDGEVFSPLLRYPPVCGCTDADYLEYSPIYACSNPDSCQTLIVLGCTDPLACNFNPSANFNVQEICCYIGDCGDLNIADVCPELSIESQAQSKLVLYPNPGINGFSIMLPFKFGEFVSVSLFSTTGQLVYKNDNLLPSKGNTVLIEKVDVPPGVYIVKVEQVGEVQNSIWIKQ